MKKRENAPSRSFEIIQKNWRALQIGFFLLRFFDRTFSVPLGCKSERKQCHILQTKPTFCPYSPQNMSSIRDNHRKIGHSEVNIHGKTVPDQFASGFKTARSLWSPKNLITNKSCHEKQLNSQSFHPLHCA